MSSEPDPSQQKLWILAPSCKVQAVREALIERGVPDENEAIVFNPRIVRQEFDILRELSKADHQDESGWSQRTAYVGFPSTLVVTDDDAISSRSPTGTYPGRSILDLLRSDVPTNVFLATRRINLETDGKSRQKKPSLSQGNELARSIRNWLHSLPSSVQSTLPSESDLLGSGTWRFTKYAPLLILPSGTFKQEPWLSLFASLPREYIQALYTSIAKGVGVTHIAEQSPIPLRLVQPENGVSQDDENENVLRSPQGLRPLYGDFGPLQTEKEPAREDFEATFWVNTIQHGIHQVWAPLYTMFANGNVNEKRRVRDFATATHTTSLAPPPSASAADLYAGIGYFAFSYAKAGYRPVLCWELNGWSIEGLRRGAEKNGWTCTIFGEDEDVTKAKLQDALRSTFIVFHESNASATSRMESLRPHLPPIQHVNCGYLPTSRPSWATTLDLVDRRHTGWLHLHENCAVEDVETGARKEEVLSELVSLEDQIGGRHVSVEHVERVKSYAPGVLHCVFDARVDPKVE